MQSLQVFRLDSSDIHTLTDVITLKQQTGLAEITTVDFLGQVIPSAWSHHERNGCITIYSDYLDHVGPFGIKERMETKEKSNKGLQWFTKFTIDDHDGHLACTGSRASILASNGIDGWSNWRERAWKMRTKRRSKEDVSGEQCQPPIYNVARHNISQAS